MHGPVGVVRGARVWSGIQFEYLGAGYCRDADGKYPSNHNKPSGTSKEACRDACAANAGCTAFQRNLMLKFCYNFGDALTDGNKPKGGGWLYRAGNGGSDAITKTTGSVGVSCERKIVKPWSDGELYNDRDIPSGARGCVKKKAEPSGGCSIGKVFVRGESTTRDDHECAARALVEVMC